MTSEGSREIDAAKQRLAAAKLQALTATKMMENAQSIMEVAKKNIEDAQSLIQNTTNEVKEAKKSLEEVEKRWDVIDIDQEPESTEKKGNKKRQKLSSLPMSRESRNTITTNNFGQYATANGTTSGTAVSSSNSANKNSPVDQIIVEGSGTKEVNGNFKRMTGKLLYGAPVYSKKGKWMTKTVDFVIFKTITWSICTWGGDLRSDDSFPNHNLYRSESDSANPPENGWIAEGWGTGPGPRCRLISNTGNVASGSTRTVLAEVNPIVKQITVQASGVPEVNGIYQRSSEPSQAGCSPSYIKCGPWGRTQGQFEIRFDSREGGYWFIYFNFTQAARVTTYRFYRAPVSVSRSHLPPETGWQDASVGRKKGPAPKLKWKV